MLNCDDLKREFTAEVYEKYQADAYGLTACGVSYDRDKAEERRLKIYLLSNYEDLLQGSANAEIKLIDLPERMAAVDYGNIVNVTIYKTENTVGKYSYEHIQSVASSTWNINHKLGFNPNVTAISNDGHAMIGDIVYIDKNNVQINFSYPLVGRAFLS